MVSPEQCATAPKSALNKGLAASGAASRSSSTLTFLLAVLAVAVASGAMFSVVIFGNEFTKDVFPTGSKYSNSVTLVDDNDRAIATADVGSYVSLLDLPLLGTAELIKIRRRSRERRHVVLPRRTERRRDAPSGNLRARRPHPHGLGRSDVFSLAGSGGVSTGFRAWTGFQDSPLPYIPAEVFQCYSYSADGEMRNP